MALKEPTAAHYAFRNDTIALLRKHASDLDAIEMLALCAHLCGSIAAMQDQRKVTPAMAMEVISSNIKIGNAEAVESLLGTQGNA